MRIFLKLAMITGVFFLPLFVHADSSQLFSLLGTLRKLVNMLIPIALAFIFLVIIWNAFKMIQTDGEEKSEYKGELIKMVIIFFVIMSFYGIISFIGTTIGIGPGGTLPISCINGSYDTKTHACTNS